jgi:hypothetical protein
MNFNPCLINIRFSSYIHVLSQMWTIRFDDNVRVYSDIVIFALCMRLFYFSYKHIFFVEENVQPTLMVGMS